MALSSITMQMLASGFAGVKLFGVKEDSPGHKIFIVLPAIGFLGAVFWGDIAPWVAVPTNVICGLFLPVSYLGFTLLQRQRDFLADDTPRGGLAIAWLAGMAVATIVLTIFLATVVVQQGPGFIERLFPETAEVEQVHHRGTESTERISVVEEVHAERRRAQTCPPFPLRVLCASVVIPPSAEQIT